MTDESQNPIGAQSDAFYDYGAPRIPDGAATDHGVHDIDSPLPSGGGGSDGEASGLPFTVSLNADGTITVLGGYFIADEVNQIASVTLTAVYIYLRIEHVSAGVLAANPVTIHGSGTALPEIDLDSGTFVKYANYLIAEIVSDEVRQYRSGNAELVLAFTNAKFHYSPILSGGKT